MTCLRPSSKKGLLRRGAAERRDGPVRVYSAPVFSQGFPSDGAILRPPGPQTLGGLVAAADLKRRLPRDRPFGSPLTIFPFPSPSLQGRARTLLSRRLGLGAGGD